MNRVCGGCTLCCKLLPVGSLGKLAGERCRHQAHGKGCRLHGTGAMPRECRLWNCRWVGGAEGTEHLPRPDRAHYVLDIMPDYVTLSTSDGEFDMLVIQVWIDPAFPDAHRDPQLRAYLAACGERDRCAAIIRYDSRRGIVVFPPALSADGQWHEIADGECVPQTRERMEKLWSGGMTLELRES